MARTAILLISILSLLLGVQWTSCQESCQEAERVQESRQEMNKKIVIALYETVFNKHDVDGVDKYVIGGESGLIFGGYIQHNPWLGDGINQLKAGIRNWFAMGPWESEILKAAADGDYVFLHVRATSPVLKSVLGGNGTVAIAEIFRLENGVVVEHWDVIQSVPETAANRHPMF